MSADIVCRVCLVKNMNLYSVQSDLQNVYERLTGEKYNRDGYPERMCYICLMVLQKCHRFMETARDTNNVLKQWYKQQNEVVDARPLYTYSISKVDSVSTYNETLQYEIKVEMEPEQEEVQTEYNTDVDIEKTDIEGQTDYSELWVDIHNDSPYTDTVEDDNVGQTDPLLHSKRETTSSASNLDDHTNTETIIKHEMSSPHDNDSPPVKKRKINETEPQHQGPEISRETVANYKTFNDTLSNSTPSQPNTITHRTAKTKSTFDKNNLNSKETAKYKPFSCSFCDYKCSKKRILVQHIRTHTGEKPFPCNICNEKFRQKHHLIRHIMRIHERAHTRTIGRKVWSCETCDYKSTNKRNFERHTRTHTGEKPFSCEICSNKYAQKCHLVRHMKAHTDEKPLSCNICFDFKCYDNYTLQTHIRAHTGEKPFSCDVCNYKSAQKSHLVVHMRSHSNDKSLSCDICGFKFKQKCHLLRHMNTHTDENPFSCELCDYKCKRKDHLVQHMRTHTNKKTFSCNICDYKSGQKSDLVVHMKSHPFSCDICDYKCKRKEYLVKHMRTHTGEKPYSCDICFNKFAHISGLIKHKRGHTGEKPFTCDICRFKFNRKDALTRHLTAHSNEKPFSCKICGYKCSRISEIERHLLAKHLNGKRNKKRK